MKQFQRTAIATGAAQFVLTASGAMFAHGAYAADAAKKDETTTVVVVGQRAALESAAARKKNADEIVDSIVADDIGKLPDKSVTEVLQRVTGITIDRTLNRVDPQQGVGDGIQHFAAEGTGVAIRGLTYVRSELNGRDSFSANGGRSLSFEDVPPELMTGLDVYKNPSAEQIEGGISGLVNLRTALPFDYKGSKGAVSVEASRSQLRGKNAPAFSGLLSNRWNTDYGQFGALVDVAHSRMRTRSDGTSLSPYIPRTNAVVGDNSGATRWITNGASWTTNNFDRDRDGLYGALQWKKDRLSSYLTYFRSKYEMTTTETSVSQNSPPSAAMLDAGAEFDSRGVLLRGVVRDPSNPGISIGTQSRVAARKSDTTDIAWNTQWRATDQWTVTADLQHTTASSYGYDNTLGIGTFLPKLTTNVTTSPPTLAFDAADTAYLADPSHYYWSFTQEHRDESIATQNAARLDAKFTFDSTVLNDLRFGVRFTNRDAMTRSTHDSDWAQISQTWSVDTAGGGWQPLSDFARLSKPNLRMPNDVATAQFANFFGGKAGMPPAVVVPNQGLLAGGPPASFTTLHSFTQAVCKQPCSQSWNPAAYGDDKGLNGQHEKTKAAYAQLRFGVDTLRFPVDGNVGVRVVRTDMSATGYTLFDPPQNPLPVVPLIPRLADKRDFNHKYTNVLPSLNVRMKASDELQFRAAYSKGMTRPDFYQMQAYTTLEQKVNTHQENGQSVVDSIDYQGSARGNPVLKPVTSTNFDLTAEYYFGKGNSLTLALFNKRLKDIIIGKTSAYTVNDTTGTPHDFLITSPVNGASGRLNGAEIGYQQYFDKLPGLLSGFGVSANYTYVDSRQNMGKSLVNGWCTPKGTLNANLARDLSGCDTDGRLLNADNTPLIGLSKNSYNLALLYDKGPWSGRLAYSWRTKYLQAVNAYGTNGSDGIDGNPNSPTYHQGSSVGYALPVWGGSYGQLDAGVHYNFNEHLNVSVEASNLTNALYKQFMQQNIGMMERGNFYTGRRFTVRMGYTF
ncbi:TonB-dependent receptor [Telluria mixta]|uniref:TonB-dependent receptor n=1 Tax=Telluria mixta TaxID=34071 RepID=A0ABT2C1I7_9BURK|nr:TonB-dependent receptor [Telluria mixta]MCS0631067.1 TonB-dependent receptor [Telluria mixta]WEM95611.1 TonB-dependent receptor [Telluria mixta]